MDLAYTYIADLVQQVPDLPTRSIISRTFHEDDRVKGILFGFAAGQELSEHTASQPAILHFIQGEADLTLGGDKMEARPGTWVHMPARLAHSVYAKSPLLMVLLLFKAPA